jgi:acetolactate synthase-1/2/3 large subunit
LQRVKIERPAMLDNFVLPIPPGRVPTDGEMNELAARVKAAKRPMLWIGSGAKAASEEILKLLDLGVFCVNSINGKGIVPEDHPMSLGGLHGNGMPGVQEFYATCDLMLAVGTRVRARETGDLTVKLPTNIVHVDCDPAANGRTYPDTYFVCGDAKLTLQALLPRIGGMAIAPGFKAEFADLKRKAVSDFLDTLGVYGGFCQQLRDVLPKDAVWVRDVTQSNTTWGDRVFPVYSPRQSVYPVGAGIGQGLSLGVGAAAAAGDRKTIVMTGDGGFFLNVGELWTAVQENLNLVVMVMNDRGYGVIKRIQDATAQGRRFFADLQGPDIGKLAGLSDIPYFKCTSAETFGATVAKALAIKGLTMVEVDMNAIGEFPPYYPFNQRLN